MAKRGKGEQPWDRVQSGPVPFRDALPLAPVLVRLEEGERGQEEALSFSAGDVMALQGEVDVRGLRLVLAHHMSGAYGETSEELGQLAECQAYTAILALPRDCLPQVDVHVINDTEGHVYSNFLDSHFPNRNWQRTQEELLETIDAENRRHGYANVITTLEEHFGHKKAPPKTLPKPGTRKPPDSPSEEEADIQPPPIPPRTPVTSSRDQPNPPPPLPSSPTPGVGKSRDLSPLTPQRPPPRVPPRCGVETSVAGSPPPVSRQASDTADCSMPTIAELTSEGVFSKDVPSTLPAKVECSNKAQASGKDAGQSKVTASLSSVMKKLGILTTKGQAKSASKGQQSSDSRNKTNVQSHNYTQPTKINTDDRHTYYRLSRHEYDVINDYEIDPALDSSDHRQGQSELKLGQQKNTKVTTPTKEEWTITNQKVDDVTVSPHPPPPPSPDRLKMGEPKIAASAEPIQHKALPAVSNDMALDGMTCKELYQRLLQCGMPGLAEVCKEKKLDGSFFVTLSDETLREPPFSLTSFDIGQKLTRIKLGWVPNTRDSEEM